MANNDGLFCLDGWREKFEIDEKKNFGSVTVLVPARFDFIGGWTDTPPYYFNNRAAVLNSSMLLGKTAIKIMIEEARNFEFTENGMKVVDVGNHLVMAKTLEYCGLVEPKIGVRIDNSIPKGSGLGGSSLLSAAILAAVVGFYQGAEVSLNSVRKIVNGVLLIEQTMESGGGWQDQMGGMLPGIKLIESNMADKLGYKVSYVEGDAGLSERCLVIDSKIQRRAAIILYSIRQKYIDGDKKTKKMLETIGENAVGGFESLKKGDLRAFAKLLSLSWQLVLSVESGSSIAFVDRIKSMCGKDLWGLKIGGAGGGGFLLAIFGDRTKREYYGKKIKNSFGDCLVYEPVFGGLGMTFTQNKRQYKIDKIRQI